MQRKRPVAPAADIVFARPYELDRRIASQRLQRRGGFGSEIGGRLRAPAEASTGEQRVHRHLVVGQTHDGCDYLVVHRLQLAAEPGLARTLFHLDGTVERLHRRMRQVREDVFGFERLATFPESARYVAAPPGLLAGLLRLLPKIREKLIGTARLCPGLVPGDLERVPALLGGPEALGVYRNALRDGSHVDDAAHLARSAIVDRCRFCAEAGRMRDENGQPVGPVRVDREHRLSGGFRGRVKPRHRRADQRELPGILQLYVFRGRDLRGLLRERAERRLLAGAGMLHDAFVYRDLSRRNTPGLRGCRNQHGARGRTGPAHLLIGIRDGRRSTGALHAKREILVQRGVCGRGLGAHLRPVCVQLLRHQRRDTGVRALSHLEVLDHHRDGIVGRDLDEAGRVDGLFGALHGGSGTGAFGVRDAAELDCNDQSGTGAAGYAQEAAPGQGQGFYGDPSRGHPAHGQLSTVLAA